MTKAKSWKMQALLGCTALAVGTLISATVAFADDEGATETVVVTGTRFNTDAAPAKASLETTEPQTIINKAYIENYLPPNSDYVAILAIVPSMTGGDPNGVGLSDGGPKNTLRGFQDGSFNMTYDGIPFGDTNGPTHHNISYFPASTIGAIDVDRGPGNAGNLGAATYGGTIRFFSEGLTPDMHFKVAASYGSFGTTTDVVNGQSGDLNAGALGTIRAMVNLQYVHSDGALELQDLFTNNALVKIEDEINSRWSVTLFGDTSFLKENLDDNNGATIAQAFVYGKNFALQNTNPNLPTYLPYNYTSKHTDMDYARVNGDLFDVVKLEDTAYTYAYWNHTFSPNSQIQTLCDIMNNTSEGNYPGGYGTNIPSGTGSCGAVNANTKDLIYATGKTDSNTAILAYSKQNAYRVYGDILRLTEDYDFGLINGQFREGVWIESQATHRFKYYYDSITCTNDGIDPFDVGDAAANAACGIAYKPFAGPTYTGPASNGQTFSKAKSIENGALGFAKDDEHSDWSQYQPFLEWDIHPAGLENLTITPGVKFIHWLHGVNAPVGQSNLCGVGANNTDTGTPPSCTNAPGTNLQQSFITRDTLPFAEVNYKIEPSWSVYFQYAKGIYVPDIGTFEQSSATAIFPAPETTTNYQLGTVYYADNFTLDADIYYIPINNNYGNPVACSFDASEQCFTNTGSATYQGVEGEGTYAFGDEIPGIDLHGLSAFANGALMYSKSTCANGLKNGVATTGNCWLANAPAWTLAGGLLFVNNHWRFSVIDKFVGPQYADGNQDSYSRIGTYSDLSAMVGYLYGNVEVDLNFDNLLDTRNVTEISSPSAAAWQINQEQLFFQSPRMVMATLKWRM